MNIIKANIKWNTPKGTIIEANDNGAYEVHLGCNHQTLLKPILKPSMINKLELLNNILQARVRYVRKWKSVSVSQDNDTITIKWYCSYDDPLNTSLFQSITYPSVSLSTAISDQKRKLKRDVPQQELEILKSL